MHAKIKNAKMSQKFTLFAENFCEFLSKFTPFCVNLCEFFYKFARKFTPKIKHARVKWCKLPLALFSAFILLNLTACSTFDCINISFRGSKTQGIYGLGGINSSNGAARNNANACIADPACAKEADKAVAQLMNEYYAGVLQVEGVKECKSWDDKINGVCAAAEYYLGKIYKVLVYALREVKIAAKTLQAGQDGLDTGFIICSLHKAQSCDILSLTSGKGEVSHYEGEAALRLMREHFGSDMNL